MRLVIARHCSSTPMGQEFADAALVGAIRSTASEFVVRDVSITGLRSEADAVRRHPDRLQAAPWFVQEIAGRGLYRDAEIVHRLDVRLPPFSGPEILTLYDLAPLRFPDEGRMPPLIGRAVRQAAAVVCPSRFSAEEIRCTYGREDVDVVPLSIDPAFLTGHRFSPEERSRLGLPQRWVLHSGGTTLRKNLSTLARAWPAVLSRFPDVGLVLCGPEHERRTALFAPLKGTYILGRVSKSYLADLVSSASAVVVPSRYEGYGLPAQEAMAAGVPLVALDAGALPEVASAGAILVADDPTALADGIAQALDGIAAADLAAASEIARSRTWDRAALAYLDIYRRVRDERLPN